MSSVGKALELLALFTPTRPEIGLSQLCRLAGRDKATTYRHLQAMEAALFVEKNPLTKAYRLGPAVLHLSAVREQTVPRKEAASAALEKLAEQTGETAHVSLLSGRTVHFLASCESQMHATRAIIDLAIFPLHATASGIAALAFGPAELIDEALGNLKAFTPATPTTEDALRNVVEEARRTGFGRSMKSFEEEIHSISAPIFDSSGLYAGSVSVAAVAVRFDSQLERIMMERLIEASRQITLSWGGTVPSHIETVWARSLSIKTSSESQL